MTGRALAALIGGLVFTAASLPVSAQNVHTSMLYEQILENIEIAPAGYSLDSFGIVRLVDGSRSRISLDLPTNRAIEIMGDCDEDCIDLDLAIYNKDGKLVVHDRAPDYYPIVNFETGEFGRVEIELSLADCKANYCYAAYSVFIAPDTR